MTSTRGNWLRFVLAGLSIVAAQAGVSSAWAQGFGPDPFRPYNSMYEGYTTPLGPGGPGSGQSVGMNARTGMGGANQFQNYLNQLGGPGRLVTDRSGIGTPYYRSSVDSRVLKEGSRDYRPNRKADESYEQTQELITQKYLAYFAERDPKRRAALIRDYHQARRRVERAISTRGDMSLRRLDAAGMLDTGRSPAQAGGGRAADLIGGRNATSRSTPADRTGLLPSPARSVGSSGRAAGSTPPAPPLPPNAALRSPRSRRTPDAVLDRAQGMDAADELKPRTGPPPITGGRPARRGSTPPPASAPPE